MVNVMTRSKLIQIWFVAVGLALAGAIALGVTVTMSTAILVAACCLVPPGIVLFMWHPDRT